MKKITTHNELKPLNKCNPEKAKVNNLDKGIVAQKQTNKIAKKITEALSLSTILPELPSFELPHPPKFNESWLDNLDKKNEEEDEIRNLQLQILRKKIDNAKPQPPKYNKKTAVLTFAERNIQIPLNTKEETLCKIILNNKQSMQKQWSWDEIVEYWGNTPDEKQRYVVYRAAKRVRDNVAKKTGISDFFLITTQTIQVHPLYITF